MSAFFVGFTIGVLYAAAVSRWVHTAPNWVFVAGGVTLALYAIAGMQ